MIFPESFITLVRNVSPVVGSLLGGPVGGSVGTLLSSFLNIDPDNPEDVLKCAQDPDILLKIKKFESHLLDVKNAREMASKEEGAIKWFRPLLVILAFLALFADIAFILYINNEMVRQVLLVMMGILVFDIKQIYAFYFGDSEDSTSIFPFNLKKRF